jgi:hypothetical protein
MAEGTQKTTQIRKEFTIDNKTVKTQSMEEIKPSTWGDYEYFKLLSGLATCVSICCLDQSVDLFRNSSRKFAVHCLVSTTHQNLSRG